MHFRPAPYVTWYSLHQQCRAPSQLESLCHLCLRCTEKPQEGHNQVRLGLREQGVTVLCLGGAEGEGGGGGVLGRQRLSRGRFLRALLAPYLPPPRWGVLFAAILDGSVVVTTTTYTAVLCCMLLHSGIGVFRFSFMCPSASFDRGSGSTLAPKPPDAALRGRFMFSRCPRRQPLLLHQGLCRGTRRRCRTGRGAAAGKGGTA